MAAMHQVSMHRLTAPHEPCGDGDEDVHLVQEVWISYTVAWSTPSASMVFSHPSARKPDKSERRDMNTACSGGKQGRCASDATAIMIAGTISGQMPWVNIRWENNGCVSGWNGIGQPWVREIW